MNLEQILNDANYKVQVSTSNDEEEEDFRGFKVTFPERTLLDTPPTPILIEYVCHDDSVDVLAIYDDSDHQTEFSYKVPPYAHRILLEADVAQHCSENAFSRKLIDYDDEYLAYVTDDEMREKEVALLGLLDDYEYKNNWRARRAAKKLGVKDGFVAIHNYFKERGSEL